MTRASDLAKLLSGGTISTADNGTQLTLESTDTDANAGPHLRLYRSVAGADSDNLGQIEFSGQDDAGNEFKYAQIESFLVDASNGTEDGYLEFQVGHGGTERVSRLLFSGTEAVINQDSKDLDFRVESDSDTHALFVEGSSGNSGIFTANGLSAVSSDAKMLQINGSYFIHYDNDAKGTTSVSNNMFFDGSNNKNLYTGEASQYYQNSGSHYWRTAASANAGSTLSPSIVMQIDATGAVTKPLQPAFQVHPASQIDNITVNAYTTIAFGTERFDNNADFGSNTFTAPVTGKYQLNLIIYFLNLDIDANYWQINLETSNQTYYQVIVPKFSADPAYYPFAMTVLADMDANDTSYLRIFQAGGAAQTDIAVATTFSGYLVC